MSNSLFYTENWGPAGGRFYFLLLCVFEREWGMHGIQTKGDKVKKKNSIDLEEFSLHSN